VSNIEQLPRRLPDSLNRFSPQIRPLPLATHPFSWLWAAFFVRASSVADACPREGNDQK
jgi:hypothetical protein